MDERTQEWQRTREMNRGYAIRGGVERDVAALKQTSMTVVAALAVMAALLVSPIRLAENPPPSNRIESRPADRVESTLNGPEGEAIRAVGAVVPMAVIPPQKRSFPVVAPHVPIWSAPRVSGPGEFRVPSELPPADPAVPPTHNLVTR